MFFPVLVLTAIMAVFPLSAASEKGTFVLSGRVADIDGKPVAGAEVFVYDSSAIRRPADFISARTEGDGIFRLVLPRRTYWVVARVRSGEKFGPLLPGDRHSGEPLIVEPDDTGELQQDFTVVDIRESVRQKQKIRADFLSVTGRLVGRDNKPVQNAYVFAVMDRSVHGVPEYISAWTGENGDYTLYLPPGRYFVGASGIFPPVPGTVASRELILGSDTKTLVLDILFVPEQLQR